MQVHAENLNLQTSMVATSEPAKVQVAVKARSLHVQAESLEAQADAQTLQVSAFACTCTSVCSLRCLSIGGTLSGSYVRVVQFRTGRTEHAGRVLRGHNKQDSIDRHLVHIHLMIQPTQGCMRGHAQVC